MKQPAYFDMSSGKIRNCKKNSIIYFHEEGHKKWFKEGKEQLIEFFTHDIIILMIPVSVFYSTRNLFLTGMALVPLALSLLSEAHAWIFAISKWRKRK